VSNSKSEQLSFSTVYSYCYSGGAPSLIIASSNWPTGQRSGDSRPNLLGSNSIIRNLKKPHKAYAQLLGLRGSNAGQKFRRKQGRWQCLGDNAVNVNSTETLLTCDNLQHASELLPHSSKESIHVFSVTGHTLHLTAATRRADCNCDGPPPFDAAWLVLCFSSFTFPRDDDDNNTLHQPAQSNGTTKPKSNDHYQWSDFRSAKGT